MLQALQNAVFYIVIIVIGASGIRAWMGMGKTVINVMLREEKGAAKKTSKQRKAGRGRGSESDGIGPPPPLGGARTRYCLQLRSSKARS